MGTPNQVDLAKLCKDFQHEIVPVGLLDLWCDRQQQVLGRELVGGKYQATGSL